MLSAEPKDRSRFEFFRHKIITFVKPGNMNSMKQTIRLLLVILIAAGGTHLFAQKSISLGLKIAPNLAWMNPGEKEYKFNGVAMGASFGFVSDFFFSPHYGLSTGFTFSFLNGNLTFPYSSAPDTGTMNRKYNFRYLEIPVMVKMKTKEYGRFSFYAQIGFGTGFRLKVQAHDEFITGSHGTLTDKSNLSSDETTLIREAILVGIGTEVKLDESFRLTLGLNYSNTLNNVLKGNNTKDPDLENRSSLNFAELSIGVLF